MMWRGERLCMGRTHCGSAFNTSHPTTPGQPAKQAALELSPERPPSSRLPTLK